MLRDVSHVLTLMYVCPLTAINMRGSTVLLGYIETVYNSEHIVCVSFLDTQA